MRFLILSILLAVGFASAQCGNVTLNVKEAKAEIVFARIMKQTGMNFIYSPDVLRGLRLSVDADNLPLRQVLEKAFNGTDVEFRIKGNNVVLSKRKIRVVANKKFVVSGFIREEKTSEPIAGVTVTCAGHSNVTNVYGFYSIQCPEGTAKVEVRGFGYLPAYSAEFKLATNRTIDFYLKPVKTLDEVVVKGSKRKMEALQSSSIGSLNLSSENIRNTPVMFGESDIIKTLQLEPGVSSGVEGFAGMYVHGGNSDENLYMLDNIPLYQVNHLGGLFSAFNTGIMRSVDFYKSSFPARYDGRLSSFMDVHTKDGSTEKMNGSFTLGLISGAFDINGPIGKNRKTSYSVGLRRSWLDILTIPALAILNATVNKEDKNKARYDLTDLNAKITHRFSDKTKAWLTVYYGEDFLLGGSKSDMQVEQIGWKDDFTNRMHWGNIVASLGLNHVFSPKLFGDFTVAYSRYFSKMKCSEDNIWYQEGGQKIEWSTDKQSNNNITDWSARADFDWRPAYAHRVNFGGSVTMHSFLPEKYTDSAINGETSSSLSRSSGTYSATEINGYIGDDWRLSDKWRMDLGLHLSLFHISGKNHHGVSPRFSLRYSPSREWAVKCSYSRSVQYVHQLTKSYISLPTDQWVPITGNFKPQTADKVSFGVYWSYNDEFTVSAETYYKRMQNLIDYSDLYYIENNALSWDSKLCVGVGNSKGIDFKISREFGKLTGQVSYSLLWADRKFAGKNRGRRFPARFDNRHKINVMLNWKINDKWEINGAWTGMSGNRYTLSTQVWNGPELYDYYNMDYGGSIIYPVTVNNAPFVSELNNYRLPFYHRLDLSVVRHTKKGFWTISLYNAYCNRNTIAIRQGSSDGRKVFQKLSIMPIIPSFSYTWKF